MASALGVFDKKQPSYASALFVELYQDEEYVNVVFVCVCVCVYISVHT